jgi:hypothetical protein
VSVCIHVSHTHIYVLSLMYNGSGQLDTSFAMGSRSERVDLLNSTWLQDTGKVVFDLLKVLQHEQVSNISAVVFKFTVQNPRLPQNAASLTATASLFYVEGVSWEPQVMTSSCASDKAPFYVEALNWDTVDIHSSSSDPCAENIVTVTLSSSIPLACTKCITLTGLTGSQTVDNNSISLTTHGSELQAQGAWTQDAGRLKVCLSDTAGVVPHSTDIEFSFSLKNANVQKAVKGEITIDVSVDTDEVLSSGTWDTDGTYMGVDSHAWEEFPIIQMSSSQPCGSNIVTVSIKPKFDVPISCCSSFTLSGLTGAMTETGSVSVTGDGFMSAGYWERLGTEPGGLTVTLTQDLAKGVWHSFSFTVLNQAEELTASDYPQLSGCDFASYTFTDGINVVALVITGSAEQSSVCMCVCVCVYMYIYIYIYTYTNSDDLHPDSYVLTAAPVYFFVKFISKFTP